MRKLPDWLKTEEALAASSKSHQYLQMNINSLRRLLGKMKQTTDTRIEGEIFVLNAARLLCVLSHFNYTQPLHHPTMDFGDFPINAYRLSSRRSTPSSVESSYSRTPLYSDCPLTKHSSKRLPEQWPLPWPHRNSGLKLGALFSNNDKRSTR